MANAGGGFFFLLFFLSFFFSLTTSKFCESSVRRLYFRRALRVWKSSRIFELIFVVPTELGQPLAGSSNSSSSIQ